MSRPASGRIGSGENPGGNRCFMNERYIPHGRTLPEELASAMQRVGELGICYPEGYYNSLVEKYTHETLPYPYIVKHIGEARIRRHFLYRELFENTGDLLDYGCGTGDAIRQLIRDGYPADRIIGFDVNDASIRLGYDLYFDRNDMENRILVAASFPDISERFDIVYSGSVIHVIHDEREFLTYLANAYKALKSGGIFFGSTLGLDDTTARQGIHGPPPAWCGGANWLIHSRKPVFVISGLLAKICLKSGEEERVSVSGSFVRGNKNA